MSLATPQSYRVARQPADKWKHEVQKVNPRFCLVSAGRAAFTLVELLVSMAVLALVLGILLGVTNDVTKLVTRTGAKTESFRAARNAFESMTRQISQATLNTYWDYEYSDTAQTVPKRYVRSSELRFISGPASTLNLSTKEVTHAIFFQAPLGQTDQSGGTTSPDLRPLDTLLNTWGYFVTYDSDKNYIPSLDSVNAKNRFRLMEMREPTENLTIYKRTSGVSNGTLKRASYQGKEWFKDPFDVDDSALTYRHILADNVVALILLPKLSREDDPDGNKLAPNYLYDSSSVGQGGSTPLLNSKNQIPPLIRVTMVAIDEASAKQMEARELVDGASGLKSVLNNKFTDTKNYDSDLRDISSGGSASSLEQFFITNNLHFRTFSTEVQILSSKWSVEETKQ